MLEVARLTRSETGLGDLHHGDVRVPATGQRGYGGGDNGLADTGPGPGYHDHCHERLRR